MTHHINNKIYLLVSLLIYSIIIGCKNDRTEKIFIEEQKSIETVKKVLPQHEFDWEYYNWFSIGDNIHKYDSIKKMDAKYNTTLINLTKDSIFLNNGIEESIYSGNINSKKFFRRDYLYNYYTKFLYEKFNINLKNELLYFRNKNIHKKSDLKNYFDEGFIVEEYLFAINEPEGIIIVFKNKKSKNHSSCLIENYFDLPYDKKINIKTVQYNILQCEIKGASDFFCGTDKLRYISLSKKNDVNLILVPMDCGDSPYRLYLLTIKNNQIISNLYVEGVLSEPENIDNLETTSFEIDENYIIKVKTENANEGKGIIITKTYRVNESGIIEEL